MKIPCDVTVFNNHNETQPIFKLSPDNLLLMYRVWLHKNVKKFIN